MGRAGGRMVRLRLVRLAAQRRIVDVAATTFSRPDRHARTSDRPHHHPCQRHARISVLAPEERYVVVVTELVLKM